MVSVCQNVYRIGNRQVKGTLFPWRQLAKVHEIQ